MRWQQLALRKLLIVTVALISWLNLGYSFAKADSLSIEEVASSTAKIVTTTENIKNPRIGTGFLFGDRSSVVTSFHLVGSADEPIDVFFQSSDNTLIKYDAYIVKAEPEFDLALLKLSQPHTTHPLNLFEGDISELDELTVVGFPISYPRLISRRLSVNDIAPSRLGEHLDQDSISAIDAIGFPSLTQIVLSVEGGLVPGYSGAPIVDENGAVVALAQGGRQRGVTGFGWGVPSASISEFSLSDDLNTFEIDSLKAIRTISLLYSTIDNSKSKKFEDIAFHIFNAERSEFMSKNNMVIQLITAFDANVEENMDPDYWTEFGRIWTKTGAWLNSFYTDLAICLSNFSCIPTTSFESLCGNIVMQSQNLSSIRNRIESVNAPMSLDFTGAFLPVAMPNQVIVPNTTNVDTVAIYACS